jgi:GNAT superfamily N-acetyltransferase
MIRFATEKDVPEILAFIKALSVYEKMEDQVVATEESLRVSLFEKKQAEVIFAEVEGVAVGFALFFHNYSTFIGKANLYLEDLFVNEKYRGQGHGKALLNELAKIAVQRECERLDWVCLNWNEPSIDFYKSLGAKPLPEWLIFRLEGKALDNMASTN